MDLVASLVKDALPDLFTEGQVVAAEQAFHRRLAEYEMNIEQQKLFREDLRDLVELTVGRMDIYHLVGALLLEFCIHFFCENEMYEGEKLPFYASTIFLLSNLVATGYLIFAVWLSMHASVASHSIGVRLLTRYARLSIPSRKELENIAQAPLLPLMDRFSNLAKRLGVSSATPAGVAGPNAAARGSGAAAGSGAVGSTDATGRSAVGGAGGAVGAGALAPAVRGGSPPARAGGAGAPRVSFSGYESGPRRAEAGTSPRQGPPRTTNSCTSLHDAVGSQTAFEEGARAQGDRQRHFRRFLREQRRWLCYDAYARVCMSLGMNQMLAALSYFLVGKVAFRAPGAAMVSLLGLQWISLLLMRLDVTSGARATSEAIVVICLVPLPPIYVGSLAWAARLNNPFYNTALLQYLFLPGYLLHGAWLLVIALVLSPGTDNLAIPQRLRTVLYLDVLHLEQEQVANRVIAEEMRGSAEAMRTLSEDLEQEMREVVCEEVEVGSVSAERRKAPELVQLCDQLQDLLHDFRSRSTGTLDPAASTEARRVEWTLERFAVWQQAPEVLANLQALQNFQVQSYLSEGQRQMVADAQQDFLRLCQDLDLGICSPPAPREEPREEGSPAAGSGAASSTVSATPSGHAEDSAAGGDMASATAVRPLQAAKLPTVRVEIPTDYDSTAIWIQPAEGELSEVQHSEPGTEQPIVDAAVAIAGTLPAWRLHAEQLLATPRALTASAMEICTPSAGALPQAPAEATNPRADTERGVAQRPGSSASAQPSLQRRMMRRSSSFCSSWETSNQPLMPAHMTPPEQLPRVVVRRFTCAMSMMWFLAAIVHLILLLQGNTLEERWQELDTWEIFASWPEPAGLFDVASLHCNNSLVTVDSGFSFYTAQRSANVLGALDIAGDSGVQAMLCGTESCDILRTAGMGLVGTSHLVSFAPPLGSSRTRITIVSALPLPGAWRRVAAAWTICSPSPCEALALAGWDGVQVVVAAARRRSSNDTWQVQTRFAVRPDRGTCKKIPSAAGSCQDTGNRDGTRGNESYSDVQALQMGARGRTLTILHGKGLLDGWDLGAGIRLGRWRLAGQPFAMCHDGRELLLAREGKEGGPLVLEAALLPTELQEVGCQQMGAAGGEGAEKRDGGLRWRQITS